MPVFWRKHLKMSGIKGNQGINNPEEPKLPRAMNPAAILECTQKPLLLLCTVLGSRREPPIAQ